MNAVYYSYMKLKGIRLKGSNANVHDNAKDEENQQPIHLSNAHNKSQQFVEKSENEK